MPVNISFLLIFIGSLTAFTAQAEVIEIENPSGSPTKIWRTTPTMPTPHQKTRPATETLLISPSIELPSRTPATPRPPHHAPKSPLPPKPRPYPPPPPPTLPRH